MRRIVLLVTSPRLPAGLMSAAAWDLVRAKPVLCAEASELSEIIAADGGLVRVVAPDVDTVLGALDDPAAKDPAAKDPAAKDLAAEEPSAGEPVDAASATVVWLAGPDGDQALARGLGLRLAREPGLAELELMYGSWDPPGARLLDVVTVIDQLASPGGDPWKRAQTHASLAKYLVEEAYEATDAIEAGDLQALRDELGDVLLQVVLHARMAQEASEPWSVDDVAGALVDKMIRRNPHVFAGAEVADLAEITRNWERIKSQERPDGSAFAGIAKSQPALSLAMKIRSRELRAGLVDQADLTDSPDRSADQMSIVDGDELTQERLGGALMRLVALAHSRGLDPEALLRSAALARLDELCAAADSSR